MLMGDRTLVYRVKAIAGHIFYGVGDISNNTINGVFEPKAGISGYACKDVMISPIVTRLLIISSVIK